MIYLNHVGKWVFEYNSCGYSELVTYELPVFDFVTSYENVLYLVKNSKLYYADTFDIKKLCYLMHIDITGLNKILAIRHGLFCLLYDNRLVIMSDARSYEFNITPEYDFNIIEVTMFNFFIVKFINGGKLYEVTNANLVLNRPIVCHKLPDTMECFIENSMRYISTDGYVCKIGTTSRIPVAKKIFKRVAFYKIDGDYYINIKGCARQLFVDGTIMNIQQNSDNTLIDHSRGKVMFDNYGNFRNTESQIYVNPMIKPAK